MRKNLLEMWSRVNGLLSRKHKNQVRDHRKNSGNCGHKYTSYASQSLHETTYLLYYIRVEGMDKKSTLTDRSSPQYCFSLQEDFGCTYSMYPLYRGICTRLVRQGSKCVCIFVCVCVCECVYVVLPYIHNIHSFTIHHGYCITSHTAHLQC